MLNPTVRRLVLGTVIVVGSALTAAPIGLGSPHAQVRNLDICVDSYDTSIDLSVVRSRLEGVVAQHVVTHPTFAVAGYLPTRWSIIEGCPSAPALLVSGERHPKNGGAPGLAGLTAAPSGLRAFVFVVPQSEIDRMFGDLDYTTSFQEITCASDDFCGEESTAFYVSPELLGGDTAVGNAELVKGLLRAVGFELPTRTRLEPVTPRNK